MNNAGPTKIWWSPRLLYRLFFICTSLHCEVVLRKSEPSV